MKENTENVVLEQFKLPFHQWKHEDPITKIIFKYLRLKSDELTSIILNNALNTASNEEKLMIYHLCAAKIMVISEILNINLEDIKEMMEGRA